MFTEIQKELARLNVLDVAIERGGGSIPAAESFVKVTIDARSCSVTAEGFLSMLRSLPDAAGKSAVVAALEASAIHADHWATCR